MASDVGIVNAALVKLGERPITSFDDNTKAARVANQTYADLRDALLRDHLWNFAIRRTQLSASSTTPTWEFDYAYPLPTDPAYCLRVLDVYNPSGYAWKVEGRSILTDIEAPIKIKYIVQVTDPGEMDAMFRDTLAAYLAQEWAENLAKSNEVQASMRKSFETKLFPARSVDGQEGTPDALITNDWTDARY